MMSGLGLEDDGRALAVADWDRDGDLDLWVSNRTAPRVRFMRNDYGNQFPAVAFLLEGDPAKNCTRDAIGAVVTLKLKGGQQMVRQLTAGAGFLSQSSKWLHFGLGKSAEIFEATVLWPGTAVVESFRGFKPGRWHLSQGSGKIVPERLAGAELALASLKLPESKGNAHVILTEPRLAPTLRYQTWTGDRALIDTQPLTLTLLWASWCQPCLQEMAALAKQHAAFQKAGIEVMALNIEEAQASLEGGDVPPLATLEKALKKVNWPFGSGRATVQMVKNLDSAQRAILYRQESLPLPSSFLWYQGQLVSFSKGALTLEAILRESARLKQPTPKNPDHAVPFPGHWSTDAFVTNPVAIASVYLEDNHIEAAREYLLDSLTKVEEDPSLRQLQEADIQYMLGETYRLENAAPTEALPFYKKAHALNPKHPSAVLSYARALAASRQEKEAATILRGALQTQPERLAVALQLGNIHQGLGEDQEAVVLYERVLKDKPDDFQAMNQLCWVVSTSADPKVRDAGKALPLAQKIMRRFGNNPLALDIAASALACAGQFEKAATLIQRALPLAKQHRDRRLVRELQERLVLYQKGMAYVRKRPS
ncbi:MAG: tetratricopeptide (TPR) repeat protein [Verrucomicrobiales bacterium]|jgi:tetratricopeptide (TPR) repeat protein